MYKYSEIFKQAVRELKKKIRSTQRAKDRLHGNVRTIKTRTKKRIKTSASRPERTGLEVGKVGTMDFQDAPTQNDN